MFSWLFGKSYTKSYKEQLDLNEEIYRYIKYLNLQNK